MSIGRISGPLLKSNLLRDGVDLAFENDLLYLKVSPQTLGTNLNEDGDPNQNNPALVVNPIAAIGIKTNNPLYDFHVNGTSYATKFLGLELQIDDVNIDGNTIKSTLGNLNINAATATDRVVIGPAIISNIYGNTQFYNDVSVDGSVDIDTNLTVRGVSTFGDNVYAAKDVAIDGNLTVGVSVNYTDITSTLIDVTVHLAAAAPAFTGNTIKVNNTTGLGVVNKNNVYYCYGYNPVTLTVKLASTKANALAGLGILDETGDFSGTGSLIAYIGGNADINGNLNINGYFTATNSDFVTKTGYETITNKTIVAPVITDGTTDLSNGTFIFPKAAVPIQTINASAVWDSDNFLLTIGTGTGRKTLVDLDTAQILYNKTLVTALVSSNTDSTSTTSGALVVTGGVGIGKNLNVGWNIDAINDISAGGNLDVGNNATVGGQMTVGVSLKFSTYAAIEYNAANDSIDFIFY